jgi:hypothetical protein
MEVELEVGKARKLRRAGVLGAVMGVLVLVGAPAAASARAPGLSIVPPGRITVYSRGEFAIGLVCRTRRGPCAGAVAVRLTRRRATRRVAHARVRLHAGRRKVLTLKLSRRARKRLAFRHRLRVTVTARVRDRAHRTARLRVRRRLVRGSRLTPARERVLQALSRTELLAAGADPSGADKAAAAVAAGFPGLEAPTQHGIDKAIDTLQNAPSEGAFTQLSDAERQAFMRKTFRAGQQPPPPADASFAKANAQAFQQYVEAVNNGTLGADATADPQDYPGKPPDEDGRGSPPLASHPIPQPPVTPAERRLETVYSVLELLDHPPPAVGRPGPAIPPTLSQTALVAIEFWSS